MSFKRILTSILVVLIAYFGSNAILDKLQNKKNISNYGIEAADERKEQKVGHEILILLVGVDVNDDGQTNSDFTRTDTIMLCKVNAENGNIDLLSIPRDSRIKVRDEFTKANHAHAYGGIELSLQSLRNFLGLDIDYYAEINYDGLVKIVDSIGGFNFNVPKGIVIDHGDVHLRPGKTKMNGMDVLWYLRTRKIYNNGDLGRVEAQQQFMKSIINEIVKKSKSINMSTFLQTYFKYVKTNVPLSIMLDFARNASHFSSDKFSTYTVPGVPMDIDGISYYIPDYEKTWKIVDKVFSKYKLSKWKKEDSGYNEDTYSDYGYENENSSEDYENQIYEQDYEENEIIPEENYPIRENSQTERNPQVERNPQRIDNTPVKENKVEDKKEQTEEVEKNNEDTTNENTENSN